MIFCVILLLTFLISLSVLSFHPIRLFCEVVIDLALLTRPSGFVFLMCNKYSCFVLFLTLFYVSFLILVSCFYGGQRHMYGNSLTLIEIHSFVGSFECG